VIDQSESFQRNAIKMILPWHSWQIPGHSDIQSPMTKKGERHLDRAGANVILNPLTYSLNILNIR